MLKQRCSFAWTIEFAFTTSYLCDPHRCHINGGCSGYLLSMALALALAVLSDVLDVNSASCANWIGGLQ